MLKTKGAQCLFFLSVYAPLAPSVKEVGWRFVGGSRPAGWIPGWAVMIMLGDSELIPARAVIMLCDSELRSVLQKCELLLQCNLITTLHDVQTTILVLV